jgi:hypothetical protein
MIIVECFRSLRKFFNVSNSPQHEDLLAPDAKFEMVFLCGLCAFARDIPIFSCGSATGLCGEYLAGKRERAKRN